MLDIRPEILRSFLGSPFSSCLFNKPKAKKKLGYMHTDDRTQSPSSQDYSRESDMGNKLPIQRIVSRSLFPRAEHTRPGVGRGGRGLDAGGAAVPTRA
jgi:hypothetical protein